MGVGVGVAASDVVGRNGKRSEVVRSGKISDTSGLVVRRTLCREVGEIEGSGGMSVGEGESSSTVVDSGWKMSDELAWRSTSDGLAELTGTGVSDGTSAEVGVKGAEERGGARMLVGANVLRS